jgi:hypothetical protein
VLRLSTWSADRSESVTYPGGNWDGQSRCLTQKRHMDMDHTRETLDFSRCRRRKIDGGYIILCVFSATVHAQRPSVWDGQGGPCLGQPTRSSRTTKAGRFPLGVPHPQVLVLTPTSNGDLHPPFHPVRDVLVWKTSAN